MNKSIILLSFILILFVLLLIPWKDIHFFKNNKKSVKYIRLGISASVLLFVFVLVLHIKTPQIFMDLFPSFWGNNNVLDWAGIWLSILSLTISSITAITTIYISLKQSEQSNFQFYSDLELPVIYNSFVIEKVTKLKKIEKYSSENPLDYDWYNIRFKLNGLLNPKIKYNLDDLYIYNDSLKYNNNGHFSNDKQNSDNKQKLYFEYYVEDNCTEFDIILSRKRDENLLNGFEDHFLVLINPQIYYSYEFRQKYTIKLIFTLEASNEYNFIKKNLYEMVLTIENKRQNHENGLSIPKFVITKIQSKTTNDMKES